MNGTSRAAVFDDQQRRFEFKSFGLPQLKEGEALVEVVCCTICGSDLHTISGKRPADGPTILGHEILGRVVEIASELRDVAGALVEIGDRITWSVAAACGECSFCKIDLPQKCESLFKYGHQVVNDQHPLSGGLAEHCHLARGTAIVKVPDSISDGVACPANCATATVAAALRVAGDDPSPGVPAVVIHGAGMLGLTAAAMVEMRRKLALVTDLVPARIKLATEDFDVYGFDANDSSLEQHVVRLTDRLGADLVLEMSGANAAIEKSIDLLRVGGKLILVGSVFPTAPVSFDPEKIVRKLIHIEGVHNYTPRDLKTAVDFLEACDPRFPLASLVDSEYGLDEIDQAIERAKCPEVIRVAVRPG